MFEHIVYVSVDESTGEVAINRKDEASEFSYEELARWAESEEFFDALKASSKSTKSNETALRKAQDILRKQRGELR
ncbi:hypothetical protein [Corynebacterium sp. HMSC066C02]|uniref:hypothetical protein n=1 Tax=Corynebacterium sp. HMSC066C02 TaxID=1739500 RepID=UPI000A5F531E|nr:hypothetical protein [Corynebacterium sp. HMSC066C02]